MMRIGKFVRTFLATSLLAAAAGAAASDTLTFTYQGVSSGVLNGVAFGDTTFTITAVSDSRDIDDCHCGFSSVVSTSAAIDIAGLGTYAILEPTRTFADGRVMSFQLGSYPYASVFDFYDDDASTQFSLRQSIGPLTSLESLSSTPIFALKTSGGGLDLPFTVTSGGTFSEVVTPVPEPASAALLVAGLSIVGVAARRRRSRNLASPRRRATKKTS